MCNRSEKTKAILNQTKDHKGIVAFVQNGKCSGIWPTGDGGDITRSYRRFSWLKRVDPVGIQVSDERVAVRWSVEKHKLAPTRVTWIKEGESGEFLDRRRQIYYAHEFTFPCQPG